MKEINIVLSGVGGQGILVASDILAEAAMESGLDVKKSEVHGMAQRGGSVVSQVRFGEKIYSPLIRKGGADFILAFEKLEALRCLDLLKPGGTVIMNDQRITPLTVYFEDIPYPENIEEICRDRAKDVLVFPAIKLAEQLGDPRVLNTIMLGILSRFLGFEEERWLECIKRRVPRKTLPLNREAFKRGRAVSVKIEGCS